MPTKLIKKKGQVLLAKWGIFAVLKKKFGNKKKAKNITRVVENYRDRDMKLITKSKFIQEFNQYSRVWADLLKRKQNIDTLVTIKKIQ